MLADALRPFSAELAARFDGIPVPVALQHPATDHAIGGGPFEPLDLTDPDLHTALLVGPRALFDVGAVHRLARALGAPVANTWGAKGIYPWNSPHHMGTCGLQRDDFTLLGLGDFDLVVTIGLDEAETRPEVPAHTRFVAGDLRRMPLPDAPRELHPAGDNELFRRLSAIAQPGYVDESFPRHPARAVMDLKQPLGPDTRVTAQPGDAGLWVARTFPTDRLGSVVVPADDRPGIGAAVGLVSAAQGTDTVTVVHGPVDETTAAALDIAGHHHLPLRLEVWGDDVDWTRTEDLVSAAGPVVAWTT